MPVFTADFRERITIMPLIEEVPLVACQSALRRPLIRGTRNPATGKKVLTQAFAIPLHTDQMLDFVDHYIPEKRHCSDPEKYRIFIDTLHEFIPQEWKLELAWVLVPVMSKIWHTIGIAICANRSEEEMSRAEDSALIKQIQDSLAVWTQPGWYFITNPRDEY
ncbi:hypothetical protein DFP72DRAFT_285358 [Ephemerocybe angulata]|uniref:Uncharacterized protein n=1 Tax=Ephemerocybe angulata TaxID=980116 RepID=A0A8H6M5F9_9AGAR|nr:hypothetical protein DFP72DRAFT_285358 [Tulosesus angulatus]